AVALSRMCCAIPRTGCRMQSWTQPVDCTTFETRTQSGGSKPNENLIPDKVYYRTLEADRMIPKRRNTKLTECWWRVYEIIIRNNPDCTRPLDPFSPSKV